MIPNIKSKIIRSINQIKYIPKYSNQLNLNEFSPALTTSEIQMLSVLNAVRAMGEEKARKSKSVENKLKRELDNSIINDVKFTIPCSLFLDEEYAEKCKYYKSNYKNLKKYR